MSKETDDIIKEYKAYLDEAQKLFGSKTPAQIRREGKNSDIPEEQRKYYHPEEFLNGLLQRGGMVPIMLFNSAELGKRMSAEELKTKLDYWDAIKTTYNAILEDADGFGAEYETWRSRYPELSNRQAQAVFCAGLFQQQYMDYVLSAPFDGMFAPITSTEKLHGDCDTKSYLMGCLLMQARDNKHAPIFTPSDISFEHFPPAPGSHVSHLRMKIKDAYIYEAAGISNGKESPGFCKKEEATPASTAADATYSAEVSLATQFFAENIKGFLELNPEQAYFVLRPFALINAQNSHMYDGSGAIAQGFSHCLTRTQQVVKSNGRAVDNASDAKHKFAEAYHGNKAFLALFENTDNISVMGWGATAKERLRELKTLSPMEYAKLEALDAQNTQGTGNYAPFKPVQPGQSQATPPR